MKTQNALYDVLIVGGGPAGLYAAYCLAKADRRVAVFEEHPEIGHPAHCTGLVATETFTRFDLPRPAQWTALRRARFHSPGGHAFSLASDQDESIALDRPAFDRGLAAQARAAGADIFTGHRVEALQRQDNHLAAGVVGKEGARRVYGRLGILATGASYRLHRALGLSAPRRFVHGVQVDVEFEETPEVELYFGNDVAPGSFAWIVPFTRRGAAIAKIGVLASRDASHYLARFLQSPTVTRRTHGLPHPYAPRPIPVLPLSKTFSDRVVAIGDAAGLAKPTTGGGIYYSLLSAELAAQTLCEALDANNGSAHFLRRYQTAWRAALGSEIRVGSLFRAFASRLSDAQIDEAIDAMTQEPLARLIRKHALFNWHKHLLMALWRSAPARRFVRHALTAQRSRILSAFHGRAECPIISGRSFDGGLNDALTKV